MRKHKPNFFPPFTLIRAGGAETYVFDNMNALASFVSQYRIRVEEYHVSSIADKVFRDYKSLGFFGYTPTYNDWIVRDDLGQIVTDNDLYERPNYHTRWWYKGEREKLHAAELGLPIPGTGKRRRWWRGCYRNMRHMSKTRAMAISIDCEREENVRIKGNLDNKNNYIDPWDDYPRGSRYNHNWKQYRKTQWKEKS